MSPLSKLSTFALLCGCVLFLSSQKANAKGYSPAVAGSTVAWTNATIAKAQLSSAAVGVVVTAPATFSVAVGALVPAIVSGTIAGAQFAGAWGAAIGAVGAVAIYAMPAIRSAMDRAGITVKPDGSMVGPDPDACTVGPCYKYVANYTGPKASTSGVPKTRAGACAEFISVLSINFPSYGYAGVSREAVGGQCWFNATAYGGSDSRVTMDEVRVSPSLGEGVPITVADAQVKLTAQSPTAAEVQALVDANFPPEVVPQSITGPASISGANTVKLGTDGSSQTETCKFYVDYFPSNIKAHPECSTVTSIPERTDTKTVTTSNPDGSTSTQVISTTTPASSSTSVVTGDKVKQEDQLPSDSQLGDVPVLYSPKYPLGLVGVWAVQRVALVATPLANLASSLMPSVASSGSCPSMMVNLSLSSWANFGTHNVAPPCSIWDFGRIVILISALLLARRLIFGG